MAKGITNTESELLIRRELLMKAVRDIDKTLASLGMGAHRYNTEASYKEKIVFIVTELKLASTKMIWEYILEEEPDVKDDKQAVERVKRGVKTFVQELKNAKILKTKKGDNYQERTLYYL